MPDLLTLFERDTTLKRIASTNGGEYAGPCPFCGGTDRFRVWPNHDGGGRWWCRQCERSGDAIQYIRERDGLSYHEALDRLGLEASNNGPRRQPAKPAPVVSKKAQRPTWDTAAALQVVETCEAALWSDAGAKARGWLHDRGLSDDTIRAWRLGYNPAAGEVGGLYVARGVVLPCFVDGAVQYVKVRRPVPPLPGPKYKQVKGSKAALYGLDRLEGRRVVVICEGELDAVLLWQEAGDLVDVVAVGSASGRPVLAHLTRLAGAGRWLVALDRDRAGEKGAAWWGDYSARVRRVRPLQGNDLTDFHQAGGDLRAWIEYHLRVDVVERQTADQAADLRENTTRLTALETEARLELLLAEMEAATGCDDAEAERLLARWEAAQ